MTIVSLRLTMGTMLRLGLGNLAAITLYRAKLTSGLFKYLTPVRPPIDGDLFSDGPGLEVQSATSDATASSPATELTRGYYRYFSHAQHETGSPPDWFYDPFSGIRLGAHTRHWSHVHEFEEGISDIKCIWEPSRFDWSVALARAYKASGDPGLFALMNLWAADWLECNPANRGPNWRCAQETGLRLLHVLLAQYLLNEARAATPALKRFVEEHCARIEPAMSYGSAQQNNHGTSEAAALYVGGAFLQHAADNNGGVHRNALRWYTTGLKRLEERVERLVAADGSFSQYSTNYHRVLLDTLCNVEFWRRRLKLPAFSTSFYDRARAAVEWLYQLLDQHSGHVPNVGANDGARLFSLCDTDYRDFRPTLQLAAALFLDERMVDDGPWDEALQWLQVTPAGRTSRPPQSTLFDGGGFVTLRPPGADTWAAIRYPRFRFRPSHADALHMDLWYRGRNILRDGGTYSYAAKEPWYSYFPGTRSHNTVEFDGEDQMPRIGRFLFAKWLSPDAVSSVSASDNNVEWAGSYTDHRGCRHTRRVSAHGRTWQVEDNIGGFKKRAVLRWRLVPGDWQVQEYSLLAHGIRISIRTESPIVRFELVQGWESLYYMHRSPLPVLEVEFDPGEHTVVTEIRLPE